MSSNHLLINHGYGRLFKYLFILFRETIIFFQSYYLDPFTSLA